MSRPTLSVVMCNYNHAHYLKDSLPALTGQSREPDELIILDDGSTDDSLDVIEAFTRGKPYVKLIKLNPNRGVMEAARIATSAATGDYIYSTAADDRILPGFFEKSMNLLCKHPDAGLSCSYPSTFLDERPEKVSPNPVAWSKDPCYFTPDELAEVMQGRSIAGHASILKRSLVEQAGGFIARLRWHTDWFLCHVIAFRSGIVYVPEPLATLRVRQDSYSAAGQREWEQQREVLLNLIDLLLSAEYSDVLPHFVRSSVFSVFGDSIVRAVMSDPKYWEPRVQMLIAQPLSAWSAAMTPVSGQSLVKQLFRRVRDRFLPG